MTNTVDTASMSSSRQKPGLFPLPNGTYLVAGGKSLSCEIFTLNSRPTVTAGASALSIQPGESVAFTSTSADADGDPLTLTWNFGDGSSGDGPNPIHTFTAPGTYTVTLGATDTPTFQPALTASATLTIKVLPGRPTPRFTTSDVVGFVGLPLTFDASRSTDDENGISAYAWNFGDGSPSGAGQVISKIYKAAGTYNVTLTITDADGFMPTLTRRIEILPADQAGLFNGFIQYKVRWDRNKTNADTISVTARVNIGDDDATIGLGTAVAVDVLGQRFTSTLDNKLKSKSASAMWSVTANTRKQKPGQVDIKATIKKASLGLAFNQAGITGSGDTVEALVPIQVEIAGRAFNVLADSTLKFSPDGTKASGDGEGP